MPKKQQKKAPKRSAVASAGKKHGVGGGARIVNKKRSRPQSKQSQSKKESNTFRFAPPLQRVLENVSPDVHRRNFSDGAIS
jgi:hypothetical protein